MKRIILAIMIIAMMAVNAGAHGMADPPPNPFWSKVPGHEVDGDLTVAGTLDATFGTECAAPMTSGTAPYALSQTQPVAGNCFAVTDMVPFDSDPGLASETKILFTSTACTDIAANTIYWYCNENNSGGDDSDPLAATLRTIAGDCVNATSVLDITLTSATNQTMRLVTCTAGAFYNDTDSDDCLDTSGGDGVLCLCSPEDEYNIVYSGNLTVTNTGTGNTVVFEDEAGDTTPFVVDLDGNVGIGMVSPTQSLDVVGFINTDQYSGYKQAGDTILYASSTNFSTLVGIGAGNSLEATGIRNTFTGYQSGYLTTTGTYNTANGYYSLNSNTTGSNNTANGYQSLRYNTTGARNTANGYLSLYSNTTGSNNTANGYYSLFYNTIGTYNTANGYYSLYFNTTGTDNTANGYASLYSNTTGYNNIGLGYNSGRNVTTGSNNIVIGYNVYAPTATSDNTLNIGNLIFGTGIDGEETTISSGNIGIGIIPTEKLQISGNIYLQDNDKSIYGTGKDSEIYFDSVTDRFIIDPNVVGTSKVYIGVTGNDTINAGGYETAGVAGITDNTSFWLCTASDCSTTCQTTIAGGIITGCP